MMILPLWAPFALLLVFFTGFLTRTLWVKKNLGENPNHIKPTDDVMGFVGRVYAGFAILHTGYIFLRIFRPDLDILTGPLLIMNNEALNNAGFALAAIGVIWCFYSQAYMSNSWRIGIPDAKEGGKPGALVTGGPYRISRNPFFLGMQILYLGIFLYLPNSITLITWVAIFISQSVQIRLEEEFLKASIGDEYIAFMSKVRRWL